MAGRREVLGRLAAAGAWLAAGGVPPIPAAGEPSIRGAVRATITVLGTVQDGGLPHLGCTKACCVRARHDPAARGRVACLGITAWPEASIFLVDATPDLPGQVSDLRARSGAPPRRGLPVDGILLTHAHIGHYTGLMHLGREVAASRELPVHATPRMCAFLEASRPWSRLVEWGHIALRPLEPGGSLRLAEACAVSTFAVPHRDEDSDTIGFIFDGPSRRVAYIPDTDSWSRWSAPVTRILSGCDIALLDGSFFDAGELPGRDPSDVPHPTIRQSMDLLDGWSGPGRPEVRFIHMNHSNPALDPSSEASREIRQRGFSTAGVGMEIPL